MIWVPGCCEDGASRATLRRRRVTDAARKLFVENGFHATGMAQIAKESKVAVGQIYRDFSSKEDIVAALVETDCTRLMNYQALREAIRAGDRAAVRAWLHEFIEPTDDLDDARLFAEIVAESSRNERIAAIFQKLQQQLSEHMLSALALLAPGEALAERRALLSDAIMTLSLGLSHYRVFRADLDVPALVAALHAIVDRELAALPTG